MLRAGERGGDDAAAAGTSSTGATVHIDTRLMAESIKAPLRTTGMTVQAGVAANCIAQLNGIGALTCQTLQGGHAVRLIKSPTPMMNATTQAASLAVAVKCPAQLRLMVVCWCRRQCCAPHAGRGGHYDCRIYPTKPKDFLCVSSRKNV